jgi:Holliday junction resolvase RusA-like endonuclease
VTRFEIDLPLPPSANALFKNLKGGGRAKTRTYKAWRDEARYHVITAWRAAGKPEWASEAPMQVAVRLGLRGRVRDAGNCLKAIEDVLVAELPIPDDRWNDRILIERDESIPGLARVCIAPLDTT